MFAVFAVYYALLEISPFMFTVNLVHISLLILVT